MFKFKLGYELTEDDKNQMVYIFRECFGYLPWGEYLKCKKHNKHYISINEYFNFEQEKSISLFDLETKYISNGKNYICPKCKSEMDLFWDNNYLKDLLDKKSSIENFSVILLLNDTNDEILGYTYGYPTSFKNSFDLECGNLYKIEYYDVLKKLISEKYNFNLYDEINIFVWNLIAIKSKYRSSENFWGLCSNFVKNIDHKYLDYIVFGETRSDIPFYINMKLSGVDDILKTEYQNCIFTTHKKFSNCKEYFSMDLSDLKNKYGNEYKRLIKLQKEEKYESIINSNVSSYKDFNL